MTKTLNQIIVFYLHQNQNIFVGKNHNPPPPPFFKLNGRSLSTFGLYFYAWTCVCVCLYLFMCHSVFACIRQIKTVKFKYICTDLAALLQSGFIHYLYLINHTITTYQKCLVCTY